jgi:F-type H+-transporting ATPase subunit alpha
MEMESKLPDVLAEFKKGVLNDDNKKKVANLAATLVPQYK